MKYLEKKDKVKIVIFIFLLVAAIILFPKLSEFYLRAESYLKNAGALGPLIYAGLMIIAILITPIPSSPLAIISGIVFGPFLGFIYTLISATIGAVLAFLIGKYFFSSYFAKRFKKNKIYRKMIEDEDKKVLYFVFFSRLMPQISFDIVSYLAGITTLKLWKFALATLLGMIPIVFILTFFGYLIKPYRVISLFIVFALFIVYSIYRTIKHKRYYVKGY